MAIECQTFGVAIVCLKGGGKAMRKGWNGKGMFLFLVDGWNGTSRDVALDYGFERLPFIAMKTADNKVVPWLASQTDMLAEDWELLP